ncbi:MAG TPA: HEAT repeat domain-containing protein [Polyangiales bacterium]
MSIEPLQKALVDADAETRRRAVLQLSIMPKDAAIAELVMSALGDADWRVRKEAAQVALRRAHELGLMESLVRALCQGDNVGLRNASLDVLEELGEQAAPALIQALPNAPEQARKFVIEALGEAGGPLVVDELRQAAWSDDVNLAGEAIEALARIGGPEAEAVIRARLHAPDPFLRLAALEALNRLEANIAWEELAPLLEDRILRRVAIAALGRTGRPEALDPLFAALEDPALHTVGAAATALVRYTRIYGPQRERVLARLSSLNLRARTSLAALLGGGGEVELRRAAAELLAYAKDQSALGQIIVQLTLDAAAPEQLEALRYWGEEAVQPLVSLAATLEAPEERAVALELAADLVAVSPTHAAPLERLVRDSLVPALHDHDPVVVAAAARSLAPYVEASDADTLVQCALSTDPEVARSAARSLEALVESSRDAVERALQKVEIESTQAAALASVLALLGGPESLDRLRAFLSADEASVRRAALQALGRIGGARAAATAAVALADEDSEVQVAAAHVLGRLRDENGGVPGASELLLAVRSEHAQVRAAVARALGHTGLQRAIEPLTELLADHDSGVAIAAVEALGHISGAQLGSRIRAALVHPDREVVKTALRALTGVNDPSAPEQLIVALSHEAWDVRQLAAELLGEHMVERARPALTAQLARETDDLARAAISEALRALAEEVR